jgi:hypothetical protein
MALLEATVAVGIFLFCQETGNATTAITPAYATYKLINKGVACFFNATFHLLHLLFLGLC